MVKWKLFCEYADVGYQIGVGISCDINSRKVVRHAVKSVVKQQYHATPEELAECFSEIADWLRSPEVRQRIR